MDHQRSHGDGRYLAAVGVLYSLLAEWVLLMALQGKLTRTFGVEVRIMKAVRGGMTKHQPTPTPQGSAYKD